MKRFPDGRSLNRCLRGIARYFFSPLVIGSFLLAVLPASAATYYVSPSGTDANSGASLTLAKRTIQIAINVAASGDTVLVADGTYAPVTINPGITVRSINGAQTTIIDGGGVARCAYLYTNSVLDGFTVTNGYAYYGGGVYADSGLVQNCVIIGNTAANFFVDLSGYYGCYGGYGGGILCDGSRIENCTIGGNTASTAGGGIYADGGTIENCMISGNTALNFYSYGGGAWAYRSTVRNCTITGNTAYQHGGGVNSYYSMVENCAVNDNIASNFGGGVFLYYGTVRECRITGNSAFRGGGVGVWDGTLENCMITGNIASWSGGGVGHWNGTVKNCVISGNNAYNGGGIATEGDIVENCTIVENTAYSGGGGILAYGGKVRNCTISENKVIYYGGGVYSYYGTIQNCIISGNTTYFSVPNLYSYGGGVFAFQATVQDCTINGNCSDYGGGIYLWESTLLGSTISDNLARAFGAGVYVHKGNVLNCIVSRNMGTEYGGGVALGYGTMQNCTINGNSAIRGGGVWVSGYSTSTVENCSIRENTAEAFGAGVYINAGIVQNCTISGNSGVPYAGGVYVSYGRLQNCTISGNSAIHYGGGVTVTDTGIMDNCIINGNSSYGGGGGVSVHSGGTVRNCMISGNAARNSGGGVLVGGTLENCTVSGNEAGSGGGVYVTGGTVRNCIVYYNEGKDVMHSDMSSISYSCLGTEIIGVGNITNEPQFVAAGSGYGTNLVPGDYHLRRTSPCIDAGTNQSWMVDAVNLDGRPRILNGVVDIGAYEGAASDIIIMRTPTIISNRCSYGFNATGQTIKVWNAGTAPLSYALSPNITWLSLSPSRGKSTGETNFVSVSYASAGLVPGNYTGIIALTSARAINSPQTVTVYLQVDKVDQAIVFPVITTQTTTSQVGLAAMASSGLPVSFTVVSGPGMITGGTNLTFTAAGMVWVVASQVGNAIYNPAPNVTNTVEVSRIGQSITFPAIPTQTATSRVGLAATASSGLPVNFALVSGPGTISSGTNLTFTATGTVQIIASQAGDATYKPAPEVTNAVLVERANQTITFPAIPDQIVTSRVGLVATAGSGLPVSFAVVSGPGTITGGTNLTFTAVGQVQVVASQAGNAIYNPAPDVVNLFNVTKALAAVTLHNLNQIYNGMPRSVTASTVPEGLTVEITYDGSSGAPTDAGTYSVVGVVNDSIYKGSVSGTLTVAKADQVITSFTPTNGAVFATTNTASFAAQATSGLLVTNFAVLSGPGVIADQTNLTFTNSGSVTLTADQVGDHNWNPAPAVTNLILVERANQTITFPAIPDQVATSRVGLVATAGSGLPVSFAVVSGPGIITGGTNMAFTAVGQVQIVASQAGDAIYDPAPDVMRSFSVTKAMVTVKLINLNQIYNGMPRSVSVSTVPEGLTVEITYDGSSAAPVDAGTYAVAGVVVNDSIYEGSANGTLMIAKADQTITGFIPTNGTIFATTSTVGLAAQAFSGLPVTNFVVVSGPGVISSLTNLTFTNAGMVSVIADQAGDRNWNPAPAVTNLLLIERIGQTITFPAIPDQIVTSRVGLVATASSGLPVSFVVASGPGIISGGTNLAFTAAGTVRIVASQAGSTIYNSTPIVTNAVIVERANQMITFPAIPVQTLTSQVTLGATANSGLPVNFAVVSGPGTITDGTILLFTGTGAVMVVASQAGNVIYDPAPNVTNTVTVEVSRIGQTIFFPAIPDQTATSQVTLAATASSGLPVSFTIASGPGTITGGTKLTFSAVGTVQVVARQVGDATYKPAPNVTNLLTVERVSQTITFPAIPDQTLSPGMGLAATASSGLPVSFAVVSGPGMINDGTNLWFTATGKVWVVASQAGNAIYYPAPNVTHAITFAHIAQTIYVSPAGDDANDGTSWASAKQTIHGGVNVAAPGDTVLVADGTYMLTNQIAIFPGVTVRSLNGAQATIINGSMMTRCAYLYENAVLDGFTVTNGYSSTAPGGGGIYVSGGTVQNCTISGNEAISSDYGTGGGVYVSNGIVSNCTISGNSAYYGGGVGLVGGSVQNCTISGNTAAPNWGGGVAAWGSTVQDCTITSNSATSAGGGVWAYSSTVRNCTISGNSAYTGGGVGHGGGSMVQGCTISNNTARLDGGGVVTSASTVRNCVISDNIASNWGGGVAAFHATVQDCTISRNSALWGGGALAWSVTVQDSTIAGNSATHGGGGVLVLWGGTVRNCTISDNMTVSLFHRPFDYNVYYDCGGGVLAWQSTVQNCMINANWSADIGGGVYAGGGIVQNCTISGNGAFLDGGGMYLWSGTMQNCLVSGNAASYFGGGVYSSNGTVQNCTISGNAANEGGGLYNDSSSGTVQNCIAYYNQNGDITGPGSCIISHSCIGTDIGGTGNITNEPLFVSLGTGYGIKHVPGNYRPQPTSPCVNRGTNQSWMMNSVDLDGLPRILDGVVDIGAYERISERGTVQFNPSSYSVNEDAKTVTLTVTKVGGYSGAATVDYTTANASAKAGSDYASWSGTLAWSDGDMSSKTITISITNDSVVENDEIFTLSLANPGGASLGWPSVATVTILDNDLPPDPGTVQFDSPSYSVNEDAGTVKLTVKRTGGSLGAASVEYATADSTASAGSDYTAQSGTLSWSDGDASIKSITVSITDDLVDDNNETFTVTLSSVSGASLGSPSVATVTIVDNDFPQDSGTVQFDSPSYSVNEDAGTVKLTVKRTGGSSGAASVEYATADSTASAGSDYTAQSGSLAWSDGETASKTIAISITDDIVDEADETLTVTLSNPSGASLGSPNVAGVTIVDNDPGTIMRSPTALTNRCGYGSSAPEQTFKAWNVGMGSLAYALSANVSWLTISPANGTSAGETDLISVHYASAGLAPGNYTGIITITSMNAINSPQVVTVYLVVDKVSQTIIFPAVPTQTTISRVALAATASSGLPVSFTVLSGPGVISGGTILSFTTTGTVLVVASQAGNAIYEPAPNVTNAFNTVTAGAIGVSATTLMYSATYHGASSVTQTLVLTNSGQSAFTYSNAVSYGSGTGWFTVSPITGQLAANAGAVLTGAVNSDSLAAGAYVATNMIISPNATNSPQVFVVTLTVNKADQLITTFPIPGPQITTNTVGLMAETSAGLPVIFKVGSGPGLISESNLTFTGAGSVSIVASQGGDANWNTAPSLTNTVEVSRAGQTITFPPISAQVATSRVGLAAMASSGLPVSFVVVSGPSTISGGTNLSFTGAGTVLVVASQAGNTIYNPAPNVTNAVTVKRANQTISFPAIPVQTLTSQVALAATASSGLPVSFTVAAGPGTLSGGANLSFSAIGSVYVVASQAGNSMWHPAMPVTNTVVVVYPPPGEIRFAETKLTVNEDIVNAELLVIRVNGNYGIVSVDYTNRGVTAGAELDYGVVTGQLIWVSGDAADKFITIPIVDDSADEPDEVFEVVLMNAVGTSISGTNVASVTIADNDDPGIIQFAPASYSVNENGGTVTLTVTRTGGSSGITSVEYSTSNGTASAGSDYTAQSGSLSWSDGEIAGKTITVAITDDVSDEADEAFTVTLSNVGGTGLGSHNVASITIMDNDILPQPGNSQADLEVVELKFVPVKLWDGDHPAEISFVLINEGLDDLVASDAKLKISFCLSANTTFGDSDDLAIGTKTESVTLTAGSQTTIRYPGRSHNTDITIPEELKGDFYVFVSIRLVSQSGLSDPDGAYAMRESPITVRIHPADGGNPSKQRNVVNDYDGDGQSDMLTYHEPNGTWAVRLSGSGNEVRFRFGGPEYETVSGDYDGDGKVDPAIHHRRGSLWLIMLSGLRYQIFGFNFGGASETRGAVGDYLGNGQANPGLYEEQSGRWYVLISAVGAEDSEIASAVFGGPGYQPVVGDYDGDGKSDPALYEETTGNWLVMLSALGYGVANAAMGGPGYRPVPADYDGDGKTDLAIMDDSGGWYYRLSGRSYALSGPDEFGKSGRPVTGDYDGDGKSDPAVVSATGWYFWLSGSSYTRAGPYSLTQP